MKTKRCPICGETKTLDEYHSGYGGRWPQSYCKECKRLYKNARKYGLTVQEYWDMIQNVDSTCEICGKETPRPCIDHHHESGLVRGVLCPGCNILVGRIEAHPNRVLKAVKYIKKYGKIHAYQD